MSRNTPPPHKPKESLFVKQNYVLMGVGVVVIALGFFLMSGGKSDNPKAFDPNQVYSFNRITLAPIFIVLGFVIEAVAIMWKPKSN